MTPSPMLRPWLRAAVCLLVPALSGAHGEGSPASEPTPGTVHVDGVDLAYESSGSPNAETVLLIAGTGMQLISWPPELVEALVERGYRVLRFDNRDVGLSSRAPGDGPPDPAAIAKALQDGRPAPLPYDHYVMARDAVGLLEALAIPRAHVVGVSMGGAIAQLVAIDHPEQVASLTLMAADSGDPEVPDVARPEVFAALPPPPPADDKAAFIEYHLALREALASPGFPTPQAERRDLLQREVERAYDPAALARQATVAYVGSVESGPYRFSNLERIQVPTAVIQGDADPIIPLESAREIAGRIPGATLVVIPGMGHDLPAQLAPRFAEVIAATAARR